MPPPAIRTAAVNSNAPSIHGNGKCAHSASTAPANAIAKPPTTLHNMF
ncbi:hypothetical protein AXXA_10375 [Achromobacter insuavis AXX-A]|uniref:Uncharacterized protein n=1 Tax=Achromobacter insuavis AXX-A TaxID=1003200 RepID=F7SZH1_9BURK|nr:hypothetical protein AXXA_10375 [Achromobacter insuavis AXX-A]